ncbi:MAG: hypothetical protein J7L71_03465, partial [Spirochaetaceae bacterium]|nr:hypothetical protein [Spirochaetaceae bacterium]
QSNSLKPRKGVVMIHTDRRMCFPSENEGLHHFVKKDGIPSGLENYAEFVYNSSRSFFGFLR